VRPTRTYLICTTPRSGSTLLCRYLTQTGRAGVPNEWFLETSLPGLYRRHGAADFATYFDSVLERESTSNGVFGAKLMGAPDVFARFLERIAELPAAHRAEAAWERVAAVFPDVRYVWLTRRDKVRQAISLHRALRSGIWQSTQPEAEAAEPSELELAGIDDCVTDLVSWEAAWEEYFAAAGIRPLSLVYEDLVRDPGAAVRSVLAHLGVDAGDWAPAEPDRQRLADDLSERWLQAYRAGIKRERSGARRRAAGVEARRYLRPEAAPARELGARVSTRRLLAALAWSLLRVGRGEDGPG
jgi:trehalose 2-sulfotransferase